MTPARSANGAHLPPEVICEIAANIPDIHVYPKGGIAACSLTCRYWASLLRPALFSYLGLRSSTDLAQLLEFLDSPPILCPAIAQCLNRIGLFQRTGHPTPPWFHHVHIIAKRSGRKDLHFTLYLWPEMLPAYLGGALPIPSNAKSDTFPFSVLRLPRSLPGTILPVRVMRLRELRIHARDLLRLIDSLPRLQSLSLLRVLFDEDLATITRYPRRSTRALTYVDLQRRLGIGITDLRAELNLASSILQSSVYLGIDPHDWQTALDVSLSLFSPLAEGAQLCIEMPQDRMSDKHLCGLELAYIDPQLPSGADLMSRYVSYSLLFTLQRLHERDRPLRAKVCITHFELDMPTHGSLASLDWAAFEERIFVLDYVPEIVVRVGADDFSERALAFYDAVLRETILARATAAGKLSVLPTPRSSHEPYILPEDIRNCIATVPLEQRLGALRAALEEQRKGWLPSQEISGLKFLWAEEGAEM